MNLVTDVVTGHWKLTFFSITASVAAFWLLYRLYKMWQRRCSNCRTIWVKREHLLEQEFGLTHWSTTRTRCRKCKKCSTVKERHLRVFSRIEWIWRRIFYRKQFIGLNAGTQNRMYAERCRAEKLLFIIRNIEAGKRGDLAPKARLDPPVSAKLSPQRKFGLRW